MQCKNLEFYMSILSLENPWKNSEKKQLCITGICNFKVQKRNLHVKYVMLI